MRNDFYMLFLEKRGKDIVIFFFKLIVIIEYQNNIFKDKKWKKENELVIRLNEFYQN